MERAAEGICAMGSKAIVIKGGHAVGKALDVLFDGNQMYHYETDRIDTKNTHDTGCTISSAIASQLAKGADIYKAVGSAKTYVTTAIVHSLAIGKGCGPTHHFYDHYRHGLPEQESEGHRMKVDYTLYLVTDRKLMSTQTLTEAEKQAILGGGIMVQLREKDSSSRAFFQQAQEVKRITDQYQVSLIINDRLDIALAVGAFGIHIGQNDLPVPVVRKIIGKDMLLGVSVSSAEEAGQAMEDGADYLGVGAVFPTGTKTDAGMVPMEELIRIRRITNLPIVVIGGINRENTGVFRPMGIDGLAVVSSIIGQPDIRKAAGEIKKAFYGKADDEV